MPWLGWSIGGTFGKQDGGKLAVADRDVKGHTARQNPNYQPRYDDWFRERRKETADPHGARDY